MKENRIYCTEVSGECQHFMDTTSSLSTYLCQYPQGFYCNKNIAWKPNCPTKELENEASKQRLQFKSSTVRCKS